jgi:hypothetical protein
MRRTSIACRALALLAAAAAACTDEPQGGTVVVAPPVLEAPAIETPPALEAPPEIAPTPQVLAAAPAVAPAGRSVARSPAQKQGVQKKPARPPLMKAVAPAVPLEKLLAVPPYAIVRPPEPEIDEVLKRLNAEAAAAAEANGDADAATRSKLGLDLGIRTDSPIERSDLKREQVDAAARLEVSKDTILKGGVRIQRDSSDGVESNRNTTPTIGIEKRF